MSQWPELFSDPFLSEDHVVYISIIIYYNIQFWINDRSWMSTEACLLFVTALPYYNCSGKVWKQYLENYTDWFSEFKIYHSYTDTVCFFFLNTVLSIFVEG